MTFLPHALLLVLLYLWARGVPQADVAMMIVAGILPFWVIWRQRAHSLGRALLLGPVAVLAIGVVAWLAWDADERDWLMKILAGILLAAYALYNAVVFAVAGWWRSRRRKRTKPAA